MANDTPYGLTGGVYSRNRDHLEQARTEFKAGNVYFNRGITGALVGVQPFGGYGLSGTDSKAGGPDYLPLHMLPRTVVERF
jgi:1-pyrroline-5-carboxylate dehydrogenase